MKQFKVSETFNRQDKRFFHALDIPIPQKCRGFVTVLIPDGAYRASLGFAFCSHLDEFDENKGKKIALERAKRNTPFGENDYQKLLMDIK